jgi:uncharacterized membrane protein
VTSETNTEIQAGTSLLGVTKKGWVFNLVGAGQKDILTCYAEVPGHGLVCLGASGKIFSYNERDGQVRQIEGVQKLDIIYSVVTSQQGLVMAAGKNGLLYYFRPKEEKASKLMVT